MPRLTPDELYKQYRDGLPGCLWEEHVFEELMQTSKYAYFKDGAKKIKNSGKGKLSTPYLSALSFDKNCYIERQTTGDCVSHSTRNAVDISRAVETTWMEKEKAGLPEEQQKLSMVVEVMVVKV